jgi:hypothetical protein
MKQKIKLRTFLRGAGMITTALFAVFLLLVSCEQPPGKIPDTNDGNNPVYPNTKISISSSSDMAKIGIDSDYPLSAAYVLKNDITLNNWYPIGDADKPFYGVFDGNEKTITLESFADTAAAEKTYLGIFGYVKGASSSAKAEIKNLTIASSVNASSTAASQVIGLLSGYAELAEIDHITLSGIFTFDSTRAIVLGGIAGYINQTGTIIKDCNSSMTMNIAPGSGSGILTYSYVGGSVGMFRNGAGIENCHNSGNVTAVSAVSASQVFVGGITGGSWYAMSNVYHGYIQDCSFTGDILGKAMGFWTFAGGIAATIVGGTTASLESTTRIERCFATGTISVAGTSSGNPYIGGIVGYNYFGALTSQSYFTGTVIADKSGDYTGGIAGYNSQTDAPNNSRIEDCWSSGEVRGYSNAGGIVGQNQVNTYIRRCYSTSKVTVTYRATTGVGGIAGMNASNQTDAITACVALNPSLSSAGTGNNINRVTGTTGGIRSNNHAWSGMPITTGGTYTERKGLTEADGADCTEKPVQSFYSGLGWNFTNVWKMGSDGYPKLNWQ